MDYYYFYNLEDTEYALYFILEETLLTLWFNYAVEMARFKGEIHIFSCKYTSGITFGNGGWLSKFNTFGGLSISVKKGVKQKTSKGTFYFTLYGSNFHPFSFHGTLITKIIWHTKNIYFLLIWPKNRFNFDSFTLIDRYCCWLFFFLTWQSRGKRSVPLTSQVWHVLTILAAH